MPDESNDLREVIVRSVVDKEFRDALFQDQAGVLSREGYDLDPAELDILDELKMNEWDGITVAELDERLDEVARSGRLVIGSLYIRQAM